MACKKHGYTGEKCPDCRVEAEQRDLQRDLAALACVTAAMRAFDGALVPTAAEVAAKAYDLAEAMMVERAKRAEKVLA